MPQADNGRFEFQSLGPWVDPELVTSLVGVVEYFGRAPDNAAIDKAHTLIGDISRSVLKSAALHDLESESDLDRSVRDLAGSAFYGVQILISDEVNLPILKVLDDANYDASDVLLQEEDDLWESTIIGSVPAITEALEQSGLTVPTYEFETLPYENYVPYPGDDQ